MIDVCIYSDEGVSSLCLKETRRTFTSLGYRVSTIGHDEIDKINEFDVFVMPGGRDLPYLEKLGVYGCDVIRNFVEKKGGTYIGFCAGAYFACSQVQFELGTPLEVEGERPLAFFHGLGYGTLYPHVKFVYESEEGSHASLIQPCNGDPPVYVYYNGGCSFKTESMGFQYETLAVYRDIPENPPAIISLNLGQGNVLLSGVHPEISGDSVLKAGAPRDVVSKLNSSQDQRQSFLQNIIKSVINK